MPFRNFETPIQRLRRVESEQERQRQRGAQLDAQFNSQEVERLQGLADGFRTERERGLRLDGELETSRGSALEFERKRGEELDIGITREQKAQRERDVRAARPPVGAPTATPTPSFDPVEAEARRRAGIQTSPIPTEPTGPSGPEIVQRRFFDPIAAAGLQIAESPAGGGLPGVTALKGAQRQLEDVGVPEILSPLPREKTFGEAFEGGFVNPFAAIAGNEEEIQKAQAVLEEAGLPRSLAAQVIFDPLNLLPGVGFTKIDDFARLLRTATQATGRGRRAAVTALRNSDVVKDALRAGERGGPLRGGEEAGRVFPEELTSARVGKELAGFEPPRGPPPRGPTVAADEPLEPWRAVVARITEKLPEARKTYKLTELSRRAELTKRTGEFFEEFNKLVGEGVPEREALNKAKGRFAGELPDIEFAEGLAVTQEDINILMGRAATYMRDTGKAFEVDNAITAIEAMGRKRVPRPFEIKAIRNIFGDELADTIAAAAKDKTFWDTFMEVWMMPKAIRSAFDISFPARQGIMAAPRHPLMWLDTIRTSVKGWIKPQDVVDDFLRMKSDSSFVGVKVADGTVQDLKLGQIADSIGILAEEVEPFIRSGLAERIYLIGPFIRRSRISFTGAGNKLRFDLLRHTLARWKRAGTDITPERLQKLGDFFNALTGRSTIFERLGKKVNFPLVDLLQATWWSPAYRMSGPEAFGIVARNLPGVPGRDAAIGRIAAENLVAFVGTGVGILGLLKASGVADVQVDPRSSDFGKIKLGPTRINFWGTSQLVARSIAQAITTTRLDPELGPQSIDPGDVFARYFRSGASPEIGFIWDGVTGETFLGERLRTSEERGISAMDIFRREFDPTAEGGGDRWIPLAWLDIKEGVEQDQLRGGVAGAAGILGLGVASFEPRASQELQNIPEFLIELQDGTRFDQRQLNEIDEFLGRVRDFRAEIRLEFGEEALGRVTTQILIDELARSEGQDQAFADVAKLLRFGSSTRDQLRNPKWVDFIVQNIDEIRKDRPDLTQRGFVIDELRESRRELELATR